ncbi:MAG: c-type cytochrome domain-containing protein [Planctomycetota bacterium]
MSPRHVLLLPLLLAPAIAQSKGKVNFEKQVWPILEKSCIECHRETYTDDNGRTVRPKGKVMLDTAANITRSKGGKLFVAHQPDDSMVVETISLPADDEDRMPPQKKGPPLSKEQVDTIRKWIDEGADFGKWTGEKADSAAKPKQPTPKTGSQPKVTPKKGPSPLVTLAKGLKPVDAKVLAEFADGPFQVQSVGDDNPLLKVTCCGNTDEVDDRTLARLRPIQEHIYELDLARSQVGDAGCALLAKMPRLVDLDLRQTKVGNQGIKELAVLKELRSLNLFGTEVGDYAMLALEPMQHLEQLYVWQTEVSAKAVVRLRELHPGLRIVFNADLPQASDDAQNPTPRRR